MNTKVATESVTVILKLESELVDSRVLNSLRRGKERKRVNCFLKT